MVSSIDQCEHLLGLRRDGSEEGGCDMNGYAADRTTQDGKLRAEVAGTTISAARPDRNVIITVTHGRRCKHENINWTAQGLHQLSTQQTSR